MAFVREPIVRLIAVTHFWKPEDLEEFQIWQTDTENEPQQLIEAAGRTCYSDDTEVLTNEGWKHFYELRGDELIATLNPKTFEVEYHRPIARIAYPYKGKLYRVETDSLSIAVTPDHWMFHAISTKKKPYFRLMQAKETFGKNVRYLAWGIWIGQEQDTFYLPEVEYSQVANNQWTAGLKDGRPIRHYSHPALALPMDAWLEFLGYWLTDGTCYYDGYGHHVVAITQHENRMERIVKCVRKLGFNYRIDRDPRKPAILSLRINNIQLRNYLSQFGHSHERHVPRELMFLSSRQLSILVDALLYGDGTSDSHFFQSSSRRLIDDFQELLLKTGRVGRVTFDKGNGIYKVYVRNRYLEYTVTPKKDHDGWEDYEGMVYCVTVPNHIIYVRRNGKPVWCGNCYASWHNPAKRTNEQYIANLLSQGHMCYDEETEVLTAAGWKKWNEVKESDLLATLNPLTYELEYQRPIALHAYHYSGKMYRVKSRLIDLLVTPNHRLFVCPMTTKSGRCRRTFKFLTAQQAYRLNCCYLRTAFLWEGEKVDFITVNGHRLPAEPFLAFLGFFLGDGSIHSPNTVDFHLRKARKIEFLHQVVQAMGMQLKKTADNRFRLTLEGLGLWLRERCYTLEGEKRIPPEFLWLERSSLEALLSGLLSSDGHYGKKGDRKFSNTSKALIDQVQELCLKVGMAASVRPVSSTVEGVWACHISDAVTPEVNRPASNWETHDEWVDYSGMVFCATVPNGIVYVRRDGHPVWCGNSVIEHAVASFYIKGISRACSHEIVRHRHFSYSQRSTRYVDESDCNFIVPDCIADDPEAMRIFAEAVTKAQEAYRQLYELLREKFAHVEDRTLRRKLARQAARMVLPNATETALVMTGNFRAWRHFIRMRASEHADVEIRKVAVKVLKELQKVAPAVFGDFQIRQLPDGTEAAEPGYLWE